MKITIQTFAYNEEFLMPFFLKHYSFADRIHVILDADTNDNTEDILNNNPKVTVEKFKFPQMFNDGIKVRENNRVAQELGQDTDWLIIVDVDEFVFSAKGEDIRAFLGRQTGNVVVSRMWQVYRNKKDIDLDVDSKIPPVYQRCYGDPNRSKGVNKGYCKPIVLKMPLPFTFTVGQHKIHGDNLKFCEETLDGTHWAMADPCFAVKRRVIDRKLRMSEANCRNKWSKHQRRITGEKIFEECIFHHNDIKLF